MRVDVLVAAVEHGATAVQVWTLVVAGLAVLATVLSAVLLRRTGKGTVSAARKAADASERSAVAAERSAQAAQDAVGVNRDTAASVARRAEADAVAKRYQDAADQLGHGKAPVRLAGVYAMGRLADEWPERRQECVDVLCAYLRMPPANLSHDEIVVRRAIWRLFNNRLDPQSARTDWGDLRFDFTGASIQDVSLRHARFRTEALYTGATFVGQCHFQSILFGAGASFRDIKVVGSFRASLRSAERTSFRRLNVAASGHLELVLVEIARGSSVGIDEGVCGGTIELSVARRSEEQGTLRIKHLDIKPSGRVLLKLMTRTPANAVLPPRIDARAWTLGDECEVKVARELRRPNGFLWEPKIAAESAQVDLSYEDA